MDPHTSLWITENMARISWSDLGTGIELATSTTAIAATISPTQPAIVIPMSALLAAGLNDVGSMDEPEKVLLAILKKVQAFSSAAATQTSLRSVNGALVRFPYRESPRPDPCPADLLPAVLAPRQPRRDDGAWNQIPDAL